MEHIKLVLIILVIFMVAKIFKRNSVENLENTKDKKKIQYKVIKNHVFHGLKIMDKIFNKHQIYYTIGYGTLLGAVRHWDMIQWDDDADIHILRKDIDKIMKLKGEFKKHGITLKKDWKLLKLYFNKEEYPFIDLFPIDSINGKTKRCRPFNKKCEQINQGWWTSWYNFPFNWISDRKRLKFGDLDLWAPKEYLKLLKFWYGKNCLTECVSSNYDHITGKYVKPKIIKCLNLPKPQTNY